MVFEKMDLDFIADDLSFYIVIINSWYVWNYMFKFILSFHNFSGFHIYILLCVKTQSVEVNWAKLATATSSNYYFKYRHLVL